MQDGQTDYNDINTSIRSEGSLFGDALPVNSEDESSRPGSPELHGSSARSPAHLPGGGNAMSPPRCYNCQSSVCECNFSEGQPVDSSIKIRKPPSTGTGQFDKRGSQETKREPREVKSSQGKPQGSSPPQSNNRMDDPRGGRRRPRRRRQNRSREDWERDNYGDPRGGQDRYGPPGYGRGHQGWYGPPDYQYAQQQSQYEFLQSLGQQQYGPRGGYGRGQFIPPRGGFGRGQFEPPRGGFGRGQIHSGRQSPPPAPPGGVGRRVRRDEGTGAVTPRQRSLENDKVSGQCWRCHKTGHVRADCTEKRISRRDAQSGDRSRDSSVDSTASSGSYMSSQSDYTDVDTDDDYGKGGGRGGSRRRRRRRRQPPPPPFKISYIHQIALDKGRVYRDNDMHVDESERRPLQKVYHVGSIAGHRMSIKIELNIRSPSVITRASGGENSQYLNMDAMRPDMIRMVEEMCALIVSSEGGSFKIVEPDEKSPDNR